MWYYIKQYFKQMNNTIPVSMWLCTEAETNIDRDQRSLSALTFPAQLHLFIFEHKSLLRLWAPLRTNYCYVVQPCYLWLPFEVPLSVVGFYSPLQLVSCQRDSKILTPAVHKSGHGDISDLADWRLKGNLWPFA